MSKRWTPAELATLRAGVALGDRAKVIAERIGRSTAAIERKILEEPGLFLRSSSRIVVTDAELQAALKTTKTNKAAADILGCHPATVGRRAKKLRKA